MTLPIHDRRREGEALVAAARGGHRRAFEPPREAVPRAVADNRGRRLMQYWARHHACRDVNLLCLNIPLHIVAKRGRLLTQFLRHAHERPAGELPAHGEALGAAHDYGRLLQRHHLLGGRRHLRLHELPILHAGRGGHRDSRLGAHLEDLAAFRLRHRRLGHRRWRRQLHGDGDGCADGHLRGGGSAAKGVAQRLLRDGHLHDLHDLRLWAGLGLRGGLGKPPGLPQALELRAQPQQQGSLALEAGGLILRCFPQSPHLGLQARDLRIHGHALHACLTDVAAAACAQGRLDTDPLWGQGLRRAVGPRPRRARAHGQRHGGVAVGRRLGWHPWVAHDRRAARCRGRGRGRGRARPLLPGRPR
mmetsp:Transcript_70124/g.217862  ORF Transcript_70124/g.217862 Transcript_70124/m.217862 type:complete len:361 (+) Transcript_70124:498-1580(+)